ncbi:unnamed protein product [Notodromas monacha]|uniref:Uncharacterized protein n=1 Tax=Notodromas monacha TaxID=399045 RepID=A0A7R9BX35_9CRUS|nr:unnamed protein product [Notodromas monacha]CAG0922257.1 unnamed protein product [Notodromas monacha]
MAPPKRGRPQTRGANNTSTTEDNQQQNENPSGVVNEMEAGDRFSGVSMWPGMNFGYGENYQKSTHALPFNPDITLEERVEIALNWFVHPEKPANFVAFYAETVDENGHDFGPDSDEVSAAVKMADYITDYIVQKLRTMALWDDIHVIVTADHGMSPVFGTNLVNISQETSIMDKLGVSSSSPILFFYKLNENDAEIGQQLEEASERLGFELFDTSNFPEENDWHMGSLQHLPDYLAIIPLNYSFDDAFWLGPWNDICRPIKDHMLHTMASMDLTIHSLKCIHSSLDMDPNFVPDSLTTQNKDQI